MRLDERIGAVTFDLDGVLVDSESINVGSAFTAFAELGLSLDDGDVARIVGRHPLDYLDGLGSRFGLERDAIDELRRRQGRIYLELWEREARPVDGALAALEHVAAGGRPVGLATSGGRRHVERCLSQFGFGRFFASILTKDDVNRTKPDPEVYLASAAALGVAPGAMLVVEDSEYGVRAALAAGAICVAVRNGHTPEERLGGALAVIDDVGHLADFLSDPGP